MYVHHLEDHKEIILMMWKGHQVSRACIMLTKL